MALPQIPLNGGRAKARQSGKGEGGTMKVAIRNAVSNLLKNRALAHKRISVITMKVTVTEKADLEPVDPKEYLDEN